MCKSVILDFMHWDIYTEIKSVQFSDYALNVCISLIRERERERMTFMHTHLTMLAITLHVYI